MILRGWINMDGKVVSAFIAGAVVASGIVYMSVRPEPVAKASHGVSSQLGRPELLPNRLAPAAGSHRYAGSC